MHCSSLVALLPGIASPESVSPLRSKCPFELTSHVDLDPLRLWYPSDFAHHTENTTSWLKDPEGRKSRMILDPLRLNYPYELMHHMVTNTPRPNDLQGGTSRPNIVASRPIRPHGAYGPTAVKSLGEYIPWIPSPLQDSGPLCKRCPWGSNKPMGFQIERTYWPYERWVLRESLKWRRVCSYGSLIYRNDYSRIIPV